MKRTGFKKRIGKPMKRTKLAKRAKSHTAGWWQSKADDLMQDINRATGGSCESCGGKNEVLHHFITKALSSYLRYKWENGIKLCKSCHFRLHFQEDAEINAKIIAKRGQDWYNWIQEHRRLPQQTGVKYYKEIYNDFKTRTF
jgi:5-methylcytosine-specific restriction endonuclease McrA